jgi:hypothetical protein
MIWIDLGLSGAARRIALSLEIADWSVSQRWAGERQDGADDRSVFHRFVLLMRPEQQP